MFFLAIFLIVAAVALWYYTQHKSVVDTALTDAEAEAKAVEQAFKPAAPAANAAPVAANTVPVANAAPVANTK